MFTKTFVTVGSLSIVYWFNQTVAIAKILLLFYNSFSVRLLHGEHTELIPVRTRYVENNSERIRQKSIQF